MIGYPCQSSATYHDDQFDSGLPIMQLKRLALYSAAYVHRTDYIHPFWWRNPKNEKYQAVCTMKQQAWVTKQQCCLTCMRFLPHHFQSMEKAAAWYPTSATPTFSRFHSQLVITDASDPTRILRRTRTQVRAVRLQPVVSNQLTTGCDACANAESLKVHDNVWGLCQMTIFSFRVPM